MPSISTNLVITFSVFSGVLLIASLSLTGSGDKNQYKSNKRLYSIPALTILCFLAALLCALTCSLNWASPGSSFCSSPTSPASPTSPT